MLLALEGPKKGREAMMAEGSRRRRTASEGEAVAPGAAEIQEVLFTVDASTGEVVKVEKLDEGRQRRELSEEESAELAGEDEVEEIEAALAEAYESGLADAIDEGEEGEEPEAAIRRMLLGRFIGRRAVRHQIRRRLLRRLLLRRLLLRELLRHPAVDGEARRHAERA